MVSVQQIYELCSFSNLSVTSPTSHLILQPFCRFTYVTAHSLTLQLLHLRHSSFSNPSLASLTSQALHLCHLESRPWSGSILDVDMEKDRMCKTDRQNKKCSCARRSGRRKNNAGSDKIERKKLAGPLAKKELPAEECPRRNGKRKKVRGRRKY